LKKIQLSFYNDYKNVYKKEWDQFDYSSFSRRSDMTVDTNLWMYSTKRSYSYHSGYPMEYLMQIFSNQNHFNGR